MTDLMVLDSNTELLVQAFNEDTLDTIIDKVRAEVTGIEPDLSTTKGRSEVASRAHKVRKFKVRIDSLGKELVADEKAKIAKIDASRRYARLQLDFLSDEVRAPLTEWEEAEEERLRIEAEEIALSKAWDEALALDELWEREKKVREEEERLEAERQRLAAEAEERERAAREAQEARDREERERAQREADELERRQRAEREAQIAAEKAEQEEKDRIAQSERDEKMRLQREEDIRREAEERARRQMIEEEAERKRLERIAQEKAEKKAAAKRHRTKIQKEALASILAIPGMTDELAAAVLSNIDAGLIPHVEIRYI